MEENVLYYDDIVVGQEFPPRTYEITEEAVAKYMAAIGDATPRYATVKAADGSTRKVRAAHPTIAGFFTRPTWLLPPQLKMPPGTAQAEQSYRFFQPIVAGDTMTTTTRVAEKFLKKERKFVVLEFSSVNQRGEKVLEGASTGMWAK